MIRERSQALILEISLSSSVVIQRWEQNQSPIPKANHPVEEILQEPEALAPASEEDVVEEVVEEENSKLPNLQKYTVE